MELILSLFNFGKVMSYVSANAGVRKVVDKLVADFGFKVTFGMLAHHARDIYDTYGYQAVTKIATIPDATLKSWADIFRPGDTGAVTEMSASFGVLAKAFADAVKSLMPSETPAAPVVPVVADTVSVS